MLRNRVMIFHVPSLWLIRTDRSRRVVIVVMGTGFNLGFEGMGRLIIAVTGATCGLASHT